MIGYRDFMLVWLNPGFFGRGKDDASVTFDDAVGQANAWIAAEAIRVVNVETVWQAAFLVPSFVRVWYESDGPRRDKGPIPEL